MRNFSENLWNSTTGSRLHCVWVLVQDERGDRLVSIWIDPAASPIAGHQGDDTGQLDVENHLNCVLPFRG